MSRRQRQDYIRSHIPAGQLRERALLEIGALDSPTFPELSRFLDWFSRDELLTSLSGNDRRQHDRIVEPDFVVKDKRFSRHVLPARFDVILASHVIEHIADPITWLQQIAAIATDGASLFLAVPDRRFTFDYLRPPSTVADLVRAHAEDLERPSRWQMLESIFYHRPFRASHAWAGDMTPLQQPGRYTLTEAMRLSERADEEYVDVHCHVFVAGRFKRLLNQLAPMTGWRVQHVSQVAEGSNEFYARLTLVPGWTPSTITAGA